MSAVSVVVGMSGGVDSSVCAWLLKQQGRSIAGLYMKNWEEDDRDGTCPSAQDAADAAAVAEQLGIAFYARNFAHEYWDQVFERFLAEHRAGRTPNPDILCNREIKFKTFLEQAQDLGAEAIATGHYARSRRENGRWSLLKAIDRNKDQSYFLYTLQQEQLAHSLFPIGDLEKTQVRALAAQAGLKTARKKDSTGICFIGPRDFRGFLMRYIAPRPGPIETPDGQVLGTHPGIEFFTLGQRGGMGIGGVRGHPDAPWYVVGKQPERNALIVDQGQDSPCLMSNRLLAGEISWVAGEAPASRFEAAAKTRYRQADQACSVHVTSDGCLDVRFASPQRAVTPGQSLVLYRGEVCLGGGVIQGTDAFYGELHGQ